METRANFIAVGVFVVALFLALLAFVVWLSNWQAERSYSQYWIYFDGSVKGLRVGSSVTYRGITVGEVTSIGFPEDGDVERILVRTRIESDAPIRSDTVASLEIQGLAGGALIMLTGGSNTAQALTPAPGQDYAVIRSAPSQLDRLLEGAPALVEQVQELVGRVRLVFGDENQDALAGVLKNINTLTGALADRTKSIDAIIADAESTLGELREAAGSIETLSKALEGDVPKATREATAALRNIRRATQDMDKLVTQVDKTAQSFEYSSNQAGMLIQENRRSIRDFTGTTLYDMNAFIADFRVLVDNLNRLVTEVGRDPARFLFGGQQSGYETR